MPKTSRTSKAQKKVDKAFMVGPKQFKKMTGQSQKSFAKQFLKMVDKRKKK